MPRWPTFPKACPGSAIAITSTSTSFIPAIPTPSGAEALTKSNARRFGKPEDVAALALFLCSERARHVQGTAIAVDGGTTPGHY